MINGKLVLIGGTADRSKNVDVFHEICSICNPKFILIIPSAVPISISEGLGLEYKNIFDEILPKSTVVIMDIQSGKDLKSADNKDLIKRADMFFFTGGSQLRLSRIFKDSNLLALMIDKLKDPDTSMVGTSAGASAMGEMVLFSDHELVNDGKINVEKSFSLCPKMIIDSHTLERQRIYRLAKTIFLYPEYKGVGLSEDSGILIDNDKMYGIGKKPTVLIAVKNENPKDKDLESMISLKDISTTFLCKNGVFDLNKWQLC